MTAEPTLPRPHRVKRRWRETADTFTFELEPVDGKSARGFGAGQFNMLYAFGAGEVPISISGDPTNGGLVHTVRDVGPVTRRLCESHRGDVIGVRGPYGTEWTLGTDGADVVVVAGGIGLAPLRPAIYQLLAERQRFGRVAILVGARSERDLIYWHQLEAWRSRFDLHVGVTVDHAGPTWRGRVGVVTDLIARLGLDGQRTLALVCGPEVMLRRSAETLTDAGVAQRRIWVSLERNMKCAVGQCGRCQLAPMLLCRDGPVVTYDRAAPLLAVREL